MLRVAEAQALSQGEVARSSSSFGWVGRGMPVYKVVAALPTWAWLLPVCAQGMCGCACGSWCGHEAALAPAAGIGAWGSVRTGPEWLSCAQSYKEGCRYNDGMGHRRCEGNKGHQQRPGGIDRCQPLLLHLAMNERRHLERQ